MAKSRTIIEKRCKSCVRYQENNQTFKSGLKSSTFCSIFIVKLNDVNDFIKFKIIAILLNKRNQDFQESYTIYSQQNLVN